MVRVFQFIILSADLHKTLQPVFAKNLQRMESSTRTAGCHSTNRALQNINNSNTRQVISNSWPVCLIRFQALILIYAKGDGDFGVFTGKRRLVSMLGISMIIYCGSTAVFQV